MHTGTHRQNLHPSPNQNWWHWFQCPCLHNTHAHTITDGQSYTCTNVHMKTHSHTCTKIHTLSPNQNWWHWFQCPCLHNTHAHIITDGQSNTCTNVHTKTQPHTHTHTHTHRHTHRHRHTHTHTNLHAHAHITAILHVKAFYIVISNVLSVDCIQSLLDISLLLFLLVIIIKNNPVECLAETAVIFIESGLPPEWMTMEEN